MVRRQTDCTGLELSQPGLLHPGCTLESTRSLAKCRCLASSPDALMTRLLEGSGTFQSSPCGSNMQPWQRAGLNKGNQFPDHCASGQMCRFSNSNEMFVQETPTAIGKELFGNLLSQTFYRVIPQSLCFMLGHLPLDGQSLTLALRGSSERGPGARSSPTSPAAGIVFHRRSPPLQRDR